MGAEKGNTNASTRKKMAREAMRLKIDGERELGNLETIASEAVTCPKEDIPALRLRMDIAFGKLRKVMPDLKAVDHTSDGKALPAYHRHAPLKND